MNARKFVSALAGIRLANVFNPYSDHCRTHDLYNGPALRRQNLRSYLAAVEKLQSDTIWMGRDLGYRGGRRTGLALTDERHLDELELTYPGAVLSKATKGPIIAERTAAEIWTALRYLERPPLLWNVFPFHPHDSENQLCNRKFKSSELACVNDLNCSLIEWLRIKKIICIGRDAAEYAASFGVEIECIRHPSYGGVNEFRTGLKNLYRNEIKFQDDAQISLF